MFGKKRRKTVKASGSGRGRKKIGRKYKRGRFKKFILFSISSFLIYFSINYCVEKFVIDYSQDVDQKVSERGLNHFLTLYSRWYEGQEPVWKDLPHWGKTVGNMAHSYVATGLLNLHFSSYRNDKRIKEVANKLAKSFINSELYFSQKATLQKFPKRGHGIFYGHALVVLMAHKIITKKSDYDLLIKKLAKFIRRGSLNSRTKFILPPYDENLNSAVFPADQSAALLGLYLFDFQFKKNYHREPFVQLRARIKKTTAYKKFGLDLSGWNYKYAKIPRGVGLAYSMANFAQIDFKRTKTLYKRMVEKFRMNFLGFYGVREWPKDISNPSDNDSGPVFFGVGTASTAMFIGASKMYRDKETYQGLMQLESFVARGISIGEHRSYVLLDTLFYPTRGLTSLMGEKDHNMTKIFHFFTDACLFSNLTAYHWKLRRN